MERNQKTPDISPHPEPINEQVHLSYRLNRSQLLYAHFGIWMHYWAGFLMTLLIVSVIITMAFVKSWLFLIVLLIGIPPINNLHRFIGGIINPLVYGARDMDVIFEATRLGFIANGHRVWLPYSQIALFRQLDGLWVIMGNEGTGVIIPVSLIDRQYMSNVRKMVKK